MPLSGTLVSNMELPLEIIFPHAGMDQKNTAATSQLLLTWYETAKHAFERGGDCKNGELKTI